MRIQLTIGFDIHEKDWTDARSKKKKGTQILTLYAFYTRAEVESFCEREVLVGGRPNNLQREPAPGNANISTSLAYATQDYTPDLHQTNVTFIEKDHPIHVIHTPDVLALWDAVDETINIKFIQANPGMLCKFGKSLHDLVIGRFKNRYMYPDNSKLDSRRIFDKSRARISTTACSHSKATGNTEGIVAWLLNIFGVGVNKRIEHCLSSINDKTSPDQLQSFYFTVVGEYMRYEEYVLRLHGQFCYRKFPRWYECYSTIDYTMIPRCKFSLTDRNFTLNHLLSKRLIEAR